MTILEQTENRLRKSIRLLLKMSGESTRNIDIIQIEGVDYIKREIVEEIMDRFIADQPKEGEKQWIAVSERLPEVNMYCMVFTKRPGLMPTPFGISWYSDKCGFESVSGVTHWLPLPVPPSLPNDLK